MDDLCVTLFVIMGICVVLMVLMIAHTEHRNKQEAEHRKEHKPAAVCPCCRVYVVPENGWCPVCGYEIGER